MSDSLRPHGRQHTRLLCLPLSSRVCSNSCPLSWCAISRLILCQPLLLLPLIFSSTRVFSSESALCIKWSKYWSFSFIISPSNVYSSLVSYWLVWIPCSPRDSQKVFPASLFESINSLALTLLHGPTLTLYMTTGKTIVSTVQLCNMLSRFVIAYPHFRSRKGPPRESFQNRSGS